MKKPLWLLSLLLLFALSASIFGQEKKPKIILIKQADKGIYNKQLGRNRLLGNVIFEHEGALMYCDSAWLYSNENRIIAYENVKVNQGDTLFLWGDHLQYSGNTRLAQVTGDTVKLQDDEMTLYTDRLDYDRNADLAYYYTGGVITNDENRLTSREGYYHSNSKQYNFKDSVVLVNPDYTIESDTLIYNSESRFAYFHGPTTITSDSSFIYCENGVYNTVKDIAQFEKNAYIYDGNKYLTGDSLYYEKADEFGEAFNNVLVHDTVEDYVITGGYGRHIGKSDSTFMTMDPIYSVLQDGDTLHIHGDTLFSTKLRPLTLQKMPAADSIATDSTLADAAASDSATSDSILTASIADSLPVKDRSSMDTAITVSGIPSITDSVPVAAIPLDSLNPNDTNLAAKPVAVRDSMTIGDSIRIAKPRTMNRPRTVDTAKDYRLIKVFNAVRIYKSDLQGKCDSLTYNTLDSVIRMYHDPLVWSDSSQVTGDTIYLTMRNEKLDSLKVYSKSFIINKIDETKFNQIKGRKMFGKFSDNDLRRVYVNGNGQTIYYPKDNEEEFIGMNRAICSNIIIKIKDNEVTQTTFLTKPEATLYPMREATGENSKLEGFLPRYDERPKSKKDLLLK